jgi:hypothetical protein
MNILLIELETKGHHIASYLKSIIDTLQKKNHRIYLLTTKPKDKEIINFTKNIKKFFIKKVEPKKINYLNLLILQFKNYFLIKKKFKELSKKYQFDAIYLNNIDHYDKALAILGSPFKESEFSGLFLNPKILYKKKFNIFNFFKIFIYKILFNNLINIKNLKKIFILNPLCLKFISKKKLSKIELLNDIGAFSYKNKIGLNKNNCRNVLNINKSSFIILVYGRMREEKELIYLINVLKKFYLNYKIKIIVAGQQDNYTNKILKDNVYNNNFISKKFLIINKFINEKLEQVLFKSSDLIWTGYSRNFSGSSGVYFLSSINKRPVVTSNHGLIYWYNKKYQIGKSTDLRNSIKVKKIIDYFMQNKNVNLSNNFNNVNKTHNSLNFSNQIINSLIRGSNKYS